MRLLPIPIRLLTKTYPGGILAQGIFMATKRRQSRRRKPQKDLGSVLAESAAKGCASGCARGCAKAIPIVLFLTVYFEKGQYAPVKKPFSTVSTAACTRV